MTSHQKAETLYVVNYALLATHEVDSAYWHEWTMFGLPGGIQLFLVLNAVLLLLFAVGLAQLARGVRAGVWLSLGLAASGITAFVLHGVFLWRGHPAFRLPASLALLALTLVVSAAQAWYSVRLLRKPVVH